MISKKMSCIIAILLIIIVALAGCSTNQGQVTEKEISETDYKNNFTLENMEGEKVSLSEFAGKIVVLNFWATWCPPCEAEIPDFVDVYNQYGGGNLEFVGVAMDTKSNLIEFIEVYNINYNILIDGTIDQVMKEWDVRAVPTTYILGRDGEILFKNVGLMQKAQLVSEIEKRL